MRKDWQYEKLGDISSSLLIEKAKKRFNPNDVIRYIDISSIDNINQRLIGTTSFKMLDAPSRAQQKVEYGDILISTVRPNLRNIAIVNDDASNLVASSGFCVLRINDAALRRYIFYYVVSNKFTAYLGKLTNGANYPAVKETDVRKAFIPIPPKSTQLSIVSELDKLNELIQIKKEQLKDYDTLAQSIFYEMFGDPVENEKGWEVKKLKDISRKIGDGLHGTPEYSELDTGWYFINGNNLENGCISIKSTTKKVTDFVRKKYYVEMDDFTLLVSINGTLGKSAFYNGENVILGKSACYIKLNKDVNKLFIYEIIRGEYFKRYAESVCTGTTIRNVSLKAMREFPIIYPPLPLQHSFAQKIEQIEQQKATIQKTITDLETLLAARMQYWFD
jgi:restriction modification system DNA specificity domain protein